MSQLARDPHACEDLPSSPSRPSLLARAFLGLIGLYQRTAVLRAPRCRFHPTCSQYALESIHVHGAIRGLGYALARIGRCHPWHPGGVDPVKPPLPEEVTSE